MNAQVADVCVCFRRQHFGMHYTNTWLKSVSKREVDGVREMARDITIIAHNTFDIINRNDA